MLTLIKKLEGCELKAYKCSAGVWTIGYGHTYGVKKTDRITQEQADAFLREDVQRIINFLEGQRFILSENQMKALVSFIYNIGQGAFLHSTMIKYIRKNSGNRKIYNEFCKWVYITTEDGKVKLDGLVKRRKIEADKYFEP